MKKQAVLAVLLLLVLPRQGYSASSFPIKCFVAPLVSSPHDPGLAIAHTAWGTLITSDGERWTEIQDLKGVKVTAVTFHPQDPSRVYLGTRDGNLLVSSDRGRTWRTLTTELSQGANSPAILSLAIDFRNPDVLYAGVKGKSLFKSSDGGLTWKRIYNGLDMQCPTEILLVPSDPGSLYVSALSADYDCEDGRNAVFFSEDDGENWRLLQVNRWRKDFPVITDSAPGPSGDIYIATAEGALYRGDSGSRYGTGFKEETRIDEIHPIAPDAVLLATPHGLFKASEKRLERVLPGESVLSIASPRNRPESLYLGVVNLGILHSLDSGRTWHLDERCPDSPRQGFAPGEADRNQR